MSNMPLAGGRWIWFAAKVMISGALLFWLFRKFDLDSASLLPENYAPLLGALAATVTAIVLSGVRWWMILGLYALRLSFSAAFRIQYMSVFMIQFLPGFVGADAVRVYMVLRRGARLSSAIASVLLDRSLALLGLILIVVLMSPRVIEVVQSAYLRYLLLGIAAALCAGVIGLVCLAASLHRLAGRFRWLSPVALLASGLRDILRSARVLAWVLALSVFVQAMYALGLWACLQAFAQAAALTDVLAIFAPVVLFQMLPISIGGRGVREAMAVTMLAALGVPGPQALAASVILGVVQTLASLPGIVAWLIQGEPAREAGPGRSPG